MLSPATEVKPKFVGYQQLLLMEVKSRIKAVTDDDIGRTKPIKS